MTTREEREKDRWLVVIKGEYTEMPGLNLTRAQARRLWDLEPAVCDDLLATLEADHFLRIDPHGCYALAGTCCAA